MSSVVLNFLIGRDWLAVQDLEMPLMNGLEAIRIIRRIESGKGGGESSQHSGSSSGSNAVRRHQQGGNRTGSDTGSKSSGDSPQIRWNNRNTVSSAEPADVHSDLRRLAPTSHAASVPALEMQAGSSGSASPEPPRSFSSLSRIRSGSNVGSASEDNTWGMISPCYLVCISGNVRQEYVEAAQQAGIDQYCGKVLYAKKDSGEWGRTCVALTDLFSRGTCVLMLSLLQPFSRETLRGVLSAAWQKHARHAASGTSLPAHAAPVASSRLHVV
jgi:lambda repressor-like predicted transcriptional regulator